MFVWNLRHVSHRRNFCRFRPAARSGELKPSRVTKAMKRNNKKYHATFIFTILKCWEEQKKKKGKESRIFYVKFMSTSLHLGQLERVGFWHNLVARSTSGMRWRCSYPCVGDYRLEWSWRRRGRRQTTTTLACLPATCMKMWKCKILLRILGHPAP